MTRAAARKQLNKILNDKTAGLHSDTAWVPVYAAFDAIREAGYTLVITEATYHHDQEGTPTSKMWRFQIEDYLKPMYGVLTAHGAGTVADPLCRYDISAYMC